MARIDLGKLSNAMHSSAGLRKGGCNNEKKNSLQGGETEKKITEERIF